MAFAVLTRSYDAARTGANTQEVRLTPQDVGNNLLVKLFSLAFDDDPRLEAQPLYVPAVPMNDGQVHDVVYVCTMANNIWAFDANDGSRIWNHPVSLGRAVRPAITISTPAVPGSTAKFIPSKQKQRAALLLTTGPGPKTVFMGCGMTHEEKDPTHGWVIAFDVATFRRTAAWCTTPHGTGTGIPSHSSTISG